MEKKIILYMPNFIGDSINTIPAIELIKQYYPQSKITLIGRSFLKEVFKYDNRIDEVLVFDKTFKTYLRIIFALIKTRYDIGVVFVNTFASALLFRLTGVKLIAGYDNESRGFLLSYAPPICRNPHYINRYAVLVNDFLGKKYTHLPPFQLQYNKEQILSFDNDRPIVGLYLGGTNKSFRRYPEDRSIRLLQLLKDYNLVFIGDKNDAVLQSSYAQQSGVTNLKDLTGKTSISEMITCISEMDLLITIDSSPMHIACGVGTPLIAIFGASTSPTSTILPKSESAICLRVENNLIDERDYINNITPEMIYQKVCDFFNVQFTM